MKNKIILIAIVAFAISFAGLVWLTSYSSKSLTIKTVSNPDSLPGIKSGSVPWPPELSDLKPRLTAIGLPALTEEGTVLHIHQHLDIFIHGKTVVVPADIGIDEPSFISIIHTHDDTAIIHVESPTVQKFTLGQFFDIWGVRFTKDCIGGYCADGANSLKVFTNGSLYFGDPRDLELQQHEEIVVAYGTDKELPKTVPASYNFPAGY